MVFFYIPIPKSSSSPPIFCAKSPHIFQVKPNKKPSNQSKGNGAVLALKTKAPNDEVRGFCCSTKNLQALYGGRSHFTIKLFFFQ